MLVGAEALLKSEDPARGIIRAGLLRGLFILAALGTLLMDARKASNPDWKRFAAVTSHVPFVAIAQGRNRIVWREIGWLRPAIGIALFVAAFFLHPWLSGGAQAQA
jgi:uncharacterized membrane protein